MISPEPAAVRGISAVTLATHDMGRAVGFYQALGLPLQYGGEDAGFTSFALGSSHLNLIAVDAARAWGWWGRVIVYVENVDDFYRRVVERGLRPEAPPADAPWGERFFHILDPDGHELSVAQSLAERSRARIE